jgi:hypothetical protein
VLHVNCENTIFYSTRDRDLSLEINLVIPFTGFQKSLWPFCPCYELQEILAFSIQKVNWLVEKSHGSWLLQGSELDAFPLKNCN